MRSTNISTSHTNHARCVVSSVLKPSVYVYRVTNVRGVTFLKGEYLLSGAIYGASDSRVPTVAAIRVLSASERREMCRSKGIGEAECRHQANSMTAANAFHQLHGQHPHVPGARMEFNYAVLLALKGLYEAVETLA